MSTPTPVRRAAGPRTALIPAPRSSVEPPIQQAPPQAPYAAEPVSIWERHAWLVPAAGIACVLVLFTAMILLTWAAGGVPPFDE